MHTGMTNLILTFQTGHDPTFSHSLTNLLLVLMQDDQRKANESGHFCSKLHCLLNSPIPHYLRRWQMISEWPDVKLQIMQQYHVHILPPWPDWTDAFLMTSQRNLFALSQEYWSRTWYGTSTMIRKVLIFKALEEESTGLQIEWSEGPRCLVFFPLFVP